MSYEIHLSYNNNTEGFQIPVNPEEIEVSGGGNGKTYDIVGTNDGKSETRAGEINVIKSPKLREVSFSSLFPAQLYPFQATDTLYEPMYYIKLIEKWMANKRPIRFIYAAHWQQQLASQQFRGQDINMPVSIEKFVWKEVAGAPGDIEYNISLKEYVFYSARRVTVKTDESGNTVAIQQPARRPDDRIRPGTYTLKEGDNLTKVAMKFYTDAAGFPDSSRHTDIQKLNSLTDSDVKKLAVGNVLKLPSL
jgi:hypothetical protein